MWYTNKRLAQLSHNTVAKSMFCDAAILFSCVNLKIAYIAIWCICTFPDLNASFYRLQRNELLHTKLSFKDTHGFINGQILIPRYSSQKDLTTASRKGRTLKNLSRLGWPQGIAFSLLLRCRYWDNLSNLSLGMTFLRRKLLGFHLWTRKKQCREATPRARGDQRTRSFLRSLYHATLDQVCGWYTALHIG